jgi:hypothetical protein
MEKFHLGVLVLGALAAACSSSSSAAPSSGGDATSEPIVDAAPPPLCDAVSLAAVPDSGNPACFQCQSTTCAQELAACSTDCACAPAYACLQQMTTASLSSGYSLCETAIDALMNGDPALTALQGCATLKCNAECVGDQ